MKGGLFVCAAETCDEMVVECWYGAFGRIVMMDVRRDNLEVDILSAQKIFQDAGAFVVEAL